MVQGLVRLTVLAALLSGCTLAPVSSPTSEPVTAETALAGSPALSLLHSAEQARKAGRLAAAGRYLERALGVAPNSSWLYQALAHLRLEQGNPGAAEGMALRAVRLAPDNDGYRADLWELVATCRARQGDQSGADRARSRARQLRGQSA